MWMLLVVLGTLSNAHPLAARNALPADLPECPTTLSILQLHPYTFWTCGWILVVARMNSGRQIVNKHRKSAWICGPGKGHKLDSILGKAKRRLSVPTLAHFRVKRRHTILNILPWEREVWSRSISRSEKASETLAGLGSRYFSSEDSKDWSRDCYFKCKDSKTRLQGNEKLRT